MPRLTRWWLGRLATSLPSTRIWPDFAGITPISDFISVDLPMPLRPTTATISPGWTARSMPCSTSLWPEAALRLRTSSMVFSVARPVCLVAEIDFFHLGIGLHRRHVAFGQHLALVQHGDAVGDALDELHVVLDHDHRAVLDD